MRKQNVLSLNLNLKAKQDIKMPGKRGAVLPKGTPFVWNTKTRHFVAHINGSIVASVNAAYVDRVAIFEAA